MVNVRKSESGYLLLLLPPPTLLLPATEDNDTEHTETLQKGERKKKRIVNPKERYIKVL